MKLLIFLLLLIPLAAPGQALLAGSEYYDSFETLASVVIMKAAGNQAGRDWLEKEGRILPKNESSLPVIIIARGQEPGSGAEFRFPAFPHTYWTFSENIATLEELKSGEPASPSPAPAEPPPLNPSATPSPEPTNLQPTPTIVPASPSPSATPSPTAPKKKKHSQSGAIQWHKVGGQWKWQPLDRSQFKGWEAGAKAPDGSRGP